MNNELKFKLNSELNYLEDDMFKDLKKREAKRNPVTESFQEFTKQFDSVETGGNGLSVNRYVFMESEEELTAPPESLDEAANETDVDDNDSNETPNETSSDNEQMILKKIQKARLKTMMKIHQIQQMLTKKIQPMTKEPLLTAEKMIKLSIILSIIQLILLILKLILILMND